MPSQEQESFGHDPSGADLQKLPSMAWFVSAESCRHILTDMIFLQVAVHRYARLGRTQQFYFFDKHPSDSVASQEIVLIMLALWPFLYCALAVVSAELALPERTQHGPPQASGQRPLLESFAEREYFYVGGRYTDVSVVRTRGLQDTVVRLLNMP